MKNISTSDVMLVFGMSFIATGFALLSAPLGFIVAGGELILLAVKLERTR